MHVPPGYSACKQMSLPSFQLKNRPWYQNEHGRIRFSARGEHGRIHCALQGRSMVRESRRRSATRRRVSGSFLLPEKSFFRRRGIAAVARSSLSDRQIWSWRHARGPLEREKRLECCRVSADFGLAFCCVTRATAIRSRRDVCPPRRDDHMHRRTCQRQHTRPPYQLTRGSERRERSRALDRMRGTKTRIQSHDEAPGRL